MEYLSVVPRPPLDGLIDDLYFLRGTPPYPVLSLPPMPSAVLILNLGAPFLIDNGSTAGEYVDGCVLTTPTRALRFGYPPESISVGVHARPWGLAPFLPLPAAELCDLPVPVEEVWGQAAVARLRDRLAAADGPKQMLEGLQDELLRRLLARDRLDDGALRLVARAGRAIAADGGTRPIAELCDRAGVSSTHLAGRFKELIGITPKRLARTYRFATAVSAIDPFRPADWSELAVLAGFYDQAHFGHEFRSFTGLSPTRYLQVRRRFAGDHPGHPLDVGLLPAN